MLIARSTAATRGRACLRLQFDALSIARGRLRTPAEMPSPTRKREVRRTLHFFKNKLSDGPAESIGHRVP